VALVCARAGMHTDCRVRVATPPSKGQRLKPHSFWGIYVVAEATTHKHSRATTQTLQFVLLGSATHKGVFMKNTFGRVGFLGGRLSARRRLVKLSLAATGIIVSASYLLGISGWAAAANPAQDGQSANVDGVMVQYDSSGISIDAYVVKPRGGGKNPAVIVIHDNQGLNDPIREVTKRFAAAGFVAMAPDLASRLGTAKAPGSATQAINQLSPRLTVQDLRAAFAYLQKGADVDPAKISAVGFGWGGWRSFMLATSVPELYRAVVYSGATPTQGFENVHAPVLGNYAQFDFRVTGNAIWTEKTMHEAGKEFTYYVYPSAYHAFYSAGPQYNADAAKLAWARTLDFLKK
jgi:carboxymethylenebutenolidase